MSLMKPGAKYVSLAAQQTAAAAIAADTTKASLEYVNTQLGLKADSSALALKADSDTVTSALAGKVSTSTYTTGLGLKADLSYVDNQLSLKVDLSTYTPALGAKADKTYVDTQLGLKASTDSVAAGLASKVDSSTLSSALALKADLVQINAIGSDNWLKLFAQDPESMLYGTLQRNQSNAITSGPVIWPDGTAGMYTATIDASYNVPSSYTVTYGSTVTVTQPTVTRNSDGYITVRPALTITRT